jgi:hypothetical protein
MKQSKWTPERKERLAKVYARAGMRGAVAAFPEETESALMHAVKNYGFHIDRDVADEILAEGVRVRQERLKTKPSPDASMAERWNQITLGALDFSPKRSRRDMSMAT